MFTIKASRSPGIIRLSLRNILDYIEYGTSGLRYHFDYSNRKMSSFMFLLKDGKFNKTKYIDSDSREKIINMDKGDAVVFKGKIINKKNIAKEYGFRVYKQKDIIVVSLLGINKLKKNIGAFDMFHEEYINDEIIIHTTKTFSDVQIEIVGKYVV